MLSYLLKSTNVLWRRKLQAACAHPTYAEAKRALTRLIAELPKVNVSAARSLDEGVEETLTLHRLEVVEALSWSFKTTNVLETIMARAWRPPLSASIAGAPVTRNSADAPRVYSPSNPACFKSRMPGTSSCLNERWPTSSPPRQTTPHDHIS